MSRLDNPYDIQENLLKDEFRDFIECPNCKHCTTFEYVKIKEFNYNEWESYIRLDEKYMKNNQKLRIVDSIRNSKVLHIHPSKVFNSLVSHYWSAWSWEACERIALDSLKLKCLHCEFDMEYLKQIHLKRLQEEK